MNLLQTSRTNPRLLTYAQIFGAFDFNATSMAPQVTKTVAHEKPNQFARWRKYGVAGWYIGPTLEQFRCYKVFVVEKRSEKIAKVVEFYLQILKIARSRLIILLR